MPALVASGSGNDGGGTTATYTVTLPATSTATNLLVIGMATDSGVVPNTPSGWFQIRTQTASTITSSIYLYAWNPGGITSAAFNSGGGGTKCNWAHVAAEYSGISPIVTNYIQGETGAVVGSGTGTTAGGTLRSMFGIAADTILGTGVFIHVFGMNGTLGTIGTPTLSYVAEGSSSASVSVLMLRKFYTTRNDDYDSSCSFGTTSRSWVQTYQGFGGVGFLNNQMTMGAQY